MAEEYHQTAAPPEPTIYPVPGPEEPPIVFYPREETTVASVLREVEVRLGELGTRLEYRYPTRPLGWHAEEIGLLRDAVDELRCAVAIIAGRVGAL